MAGEFTFPNTIVTDSQGNIYAAETVGGRRNQKFVQVNDSRPDDDRLLR